MEALIPTVLGILVDQTIILKLFSKFCNYCFFVLTNGIQIIMSLDSNRQINTSVADLDPGIRDP
jgi:hypothetical protein